MSETASIYSVVMPKLGLTMTEAAIREWYKQEGEWVEKGEPLFGLENEKALLEIEAPASGVLHILVALDETVPVLTPVAELHSQTAAVARPAATRPSSRLVPASPKARQLAKQRGIDLAELTGSGPRGMLVAADVEQALAAGLAGRAPDRVPAAITATPVARRMAQEAGIDLQAISGRGPGGKITRSDVEKHIARRTHAAPPLTAPTEPRPLTGLRAIIAERLATGWRERPQVTLIAEADATNLVSARRQAVEELGQKVSYDSFLVLIVAKALREQPHVNVRLSEQGIEQLAQINVGVAVDTERGLLVPIIHQADTLDLWQVQDRLRGLADRALAGRSTVDELTGGTFTITNLGMFEIDAFTPIINPPEAAILGVGRIVNKPVGYQGQIVLRDMMALSLSFDHRLLDGGPAARFLQRIKQLVERPFALALRTER